MSANEIIELNIQGMDDLRSANERLSRLTQQNRSYLTACVASGQATVEWEEGLVAQFFQMLSLSPLQNLEMRILKHNIPVSLLAGVIQNTRDSLQSLKLCGNTFVGDVSELCLALGNHPSLQSVSLCENCFQENEHSAHDKDMLVAVVDSLTTCTQVQSLELQTVSERNGNVSKRGAKTPGIPTEKLCSMPRLSRLILQIKPLTVVERMCQHLCGKTTLTHLELDASIFKGEKAMAAMEAVSKLLRASSTLQVLKIKTLSQEMLPPIIRALRVNQSVLKLTCDFPGHQPRFDFCLLSDEITQSVLHTLKVNHTLEQMLIATPNDPTRVESEGTWNDTSIPFYLKLNRAGRRRLFQEEPASPKEDWVDTIVMHKNDPSVVFYFLSRNPLLLFQDDPLPMAAKAPRPIKRRKTK